MNCFLKENTVTHCTGRTKFTKEFHYAISVELQSQNIKCWLKNVWNWLSNSDNIQWSSEYRCVDKACKNIFKGNIYHPFNDLSSIVCVLTYQSLEIHNEYVKCPSRCSGKERKQTALELMAYEYSLQY